MSRSRRRTPIFNHTTGCDTWGRRQGNRILRHVVKQVLATETDLDDLVLPQPGEVNLTNPWTWGGDGRWWAADWIAGMDKREAAVEMSK